MQSQLQKAINLAKKTGDGLIVFDQTKTDNGYVVMSIDQYEDLTLGRGSVRNLTEDQLLDKINRDIAVWKSENDFSAFESKKKYNFEKDDCGGFEFEDEENFEEDEDNEEYSSIRNMYEKDFSSPGLRQMREELSEEELKPPKKRWSIPRDRKKAAEEVVEDEDRQYLEEITF